jgi:hypothetical protein
MLQAEKVDRENVQVLIQLLNQIQQTENSQDTTLLLEEIFSLLPSTLQEKLVNSNDISKALQELLTDLENPFFNFSPNVSFVTKPEQFLEKGVGESPNTLKRKLQRNSSIIQNLEMSLQEIKEHNSLLEKKYKDSVKSIKILESNLDKEKLRNVDLTKDLQEEILNLNKKIQKIQGNLLQEEEAKENLKIVLSKKLKEKEEETISLKKDIEIQIQENNIQKLENIKNSKEYARKEEELNKEISRILQDGQVVKVKFQEKESDLIKKLQNLQVEVEKKTLDLEKEQEENNELYLKNQRIEKECLKLGQEVLRLDDLKQVILEKDEEIQRLKDLEQEIKILGNNNESRWQDELLKEQESKREIMAMLKGAQDERDALNDLYVKEKDSSAFLQAKCDELIKEKSSLTEENHNLKISAESLTVRDSQNLQTLEKELLKEQESKREIMAMLKGAQDECDALNDLYVKEKEATNLLNIELNNVMGERDSALQENHSLHTKNESLLLNVEIHNNREIKIVFFLQIMIG